MGTCLYNFSEGATIFFSVLEHDFSGMRGRGDLPPNARQLLPVTSVEVKTQTPCIQGNMMRVTTVFEVSFS